MLRERCRHMALRDQDRHLRAMLGALAGGRMPTDRLVALGRRYAGHGLRSAHYGVMAQTLLWTLEQHLGASWTLAAQNAWDDTLTRAVAVMVASDRRQPPGRLSGENVIG